MHTFSLEFLVILFQVRLYHFHNIVIDQSLLILQLSHSAVFWKRQCRRVKTLFKIMICLGNTSCTRPMIPKQCMYHKTKKCDLSGNCRRIISESLYLSPRSVCTVI